MGGGEPKSGSCCSSKVAICDDFQDMRVGAGGPGRIDKKRLTDVEVQPVIEHPHLGRARFQASLAVIPPVRRDTGDAIPQVVDRITSSG